MTKNEIIKQKFEKGLKPIQVYDFLKTYENGKYQTTITYVTVRYKEFLKEKKR